MARHKIETAPRKASEPVVSRTLAKLLEVQRLDTINEVCTAFHDALGVDYALVDVIDRVVGLYPWVCNAPSEIMAPSTSPLVEHLISRPGQAFIVKDTSMQGEDALWVAIADPPPEVQNATERMICRGLFHTFRVGNDYSRVMAIQLNSCQL